MTIADDFIDAISPPFGALSEPVPMSVSTRKLARRAPWNGRVREGEIEFPDGSVLVWKRIG